MPNQETSFGGDRSLPEPSDNAGVFSAGQKGLGDGPTITHPASPEKSETANDTVDRELSDTAAGIHIGFDKALQGKNFGDYELIEEIARGGMGVVYKARQTRLNRTVALKMILSGDLAGDDQIQRFQVEAEAAANLQHSGIVPIYEVGQHAGHHYFSMGLIEGSTLSRAVDDGPLGNHAAATIVAKSADAIAYAHERGVIHRDLKPGNILMDEHGDPHVTDFGLAKRTDVDSGLTGTGQVLGTPSYMAPEQAKGETDQVGILADVYSLGGILYFLITGRPPFLAANVLDTLMQVIHQEPVAPRQLNATVDKDLETICLKCLQKEPAQRYESAQAFKDELDLFLNGQPIRARAISSTARAWRWCRRNPVVASLISLAVVLLIVGTVVSLYFAIKANIQASAATINLRRAQIQEQAARRSEAQAVIDKVRATDGEASARKSLYFANVDLARQLLEAGDVNQATLLLETHLPRTGEEDLRRFEWKHLWGIRHSESFTIGWEQPDDGSGRMSIHAVAVDPAGKHVAVGGGQTQSGKVVLYPSHSDQVTWTSKGKMPMVTALKYSLDGKTVIGACGATGASGVVKFWNVDDSSEHMSIDAGDPVMSLALSTDQAWLLTGSAALITSRGTPADRYLNVSTKPRSDAVKLWNAKSGELIAALPGLTGEIFSLALSSDGRTIAAGDAAGVVHFWDAQTREKLGSVSTHLRYVLSLDFSPDSRTLAIGAGFWDETAPISLCDVNTREIQGVLRGHQAGVTCVKYSPDGKSLASGSWDRTIKLWDLDNRVAAATCYGHTTYVWSLDFTSDGKTLVSAGWGASTSKDQSEIKFWDVARQRRFKSIEGPLAERGTYQYLDWGGQTVADISPENNQVTIWDTDGTKRTTITPFGTRNPRSVSVSRDGKLVAISGFAPTANIYDATTGELIAELETNSSPYLTFSPDGGLLAVACDSGRVALWDTVTRTQLPDLIGHTDVVWWVDFSADGRRLASGSWDKTIKIWDTETGRSLTTLAGQNEVVWKVAMLFDERTLLSAGESAVGNWEAGLMDQDAVGDLALDQELPLHEIERARRSRWYALLAMVLELQGESDVAQLSYHRANQIMKERVRRCPHEKRYQETVMDELMVLMEFYKDRGKGDDAELMRKLAVELLSRGDDVKQAEAADTSQ